MATPQRSMHRAVIETNLHGPVLAQRPAIITTASHVNLVEIISRFQVPARKTGLRHTSPFCVRTETGHLKIRVHFTKKSAKFVEKRHVLMQNMYPLSIQALRTNNRRLSPRIKFSIFHTRDCKIRGHREIMHQIRKCEQREQETQDRKYF